MASKLFVYPYPYGVDDTQVSLVLSGSVLLAGAAVPTGEPINWNSMVTGIPYNEANFLGTGNTLNTGSSLVTGFSTSNGVITVTGANNFKAGQVVTFQSCTSTLGLKLNGLSFKVLASGLSASQFKITSPLTGSGSSEYGFVFSGAPYQPLAKGPGAQNATVTNISLTSGIVTVTAANYYLPGAQVTFSGLSTTLGAKMNGKNFIVLSSTGAAFTVATSLTGADGSESGTATGWNPPQPYKVVFSGANGSGYIYEYDESTGCLFAFSGTSGTLVGTLDAPALTMNSYTPAGTNSAPTITTATGDPATAPIGVITGALAQTAGATGITGVQAAAFTGTAHVLTGSVAAPVLSGSSVSAGPLAPLGTAAYPAAVLGDIVKFTAWFARGK